MGAWAPSALDDGAFDLVDGEVRELVRRRSLDPSTQADAVRAAVDEVLDAYETRSLVGDVPAADRRVIDSVAGFGALQQYLDDPGIEEVGISERLTAGWARQGASQGRQGRECWTRGAAPAARRPSSIN